MSINFCNSKIYSTKSNFSSYFNIEINNHPNNNYIFNSFDCFDLNPIDLSYEENNYLFSIKKGVELNDIYNHFNFNELRFLENNLQNNFSIDIKKQSLNPLKKEEDENIYSLNDEIKEFNQIINERNNNLFKVIYPEKDYLFKVSQTDLSQYLGKEKNLFPLKKERSIIRNCRKYNRDNIRIKLKRSFLNALIKKLNKLILKTKKIKSAFGKFPPKLSGDISKNRNKFFLNLELHQALEKEELYYPKNINTCIKNSKIIKELKNNGDIKLNKIMNTKLLNLFIEFINSDEFKIDEINRLKRKKYNNDYIKRYIILANNFIEYFFEE